MNVMLLVAAALSILPATASSAVVQFTAPAGDAPAQHVGNAIYDAVLPSGRIVTPLGASVVTGTNALGLTLSPDGHFIIVSNDDDRYGQVHSAVDPQVLGGYSLAVIDSVTLRIVDRFAFPGETYFAGLAALRDVRHPTRTLIFAAGGLANAVYVLDLDENGHITPDLQHIIPIPGPIDPGFGDFAQSFPGTLIPARDGSRVYVVDERGDSVTAIDTAARAVSGPGRSVGFRPFGAALADHRLLVTNEGLMRYARVTNAPLVPPFASPPPDLLHASSLSIVGLDSGGDLAPVDASALALDRAPDGLLIVGGAHPTSIVVTPSGSFAFVAMTNVDRIATVALTGSAQVVGGTELRLFDRGPYGTQPAALALSQDGTRLYVALAGLNAIAVLDARDPLHLHRLGLLPTGWFPSAIELSPDDRTLYVVNTKGFAHDIGHGADVSTGGAAAALWSTVQKIDLSTVILSNATFTTLKNTREVHAGAPHYPRALRNVVVILEEHTTFDALLGDLGYGPSDPSDVRFGESITPNLHALARRYGLAGNFFADAQDSDAAHQFITGGTATVYRARSVIHEEPEDYPRAGYVFNNLERHGISFRDYGDLVRLASYDDGLAADPRFDDPAFARIADGQAPTHGLGGRYAADVPAPAVLGVHLDRDYPGWNLRVRDERRAREFLRDYAMLVAAHRQPRYTHIWLPGERTVPDPDSPAGSEEAADGDRALGTIVQYLSRLRSWKNTAIFVLPDDTQDSRDHVDVDRAYAVVVSPFAKRHYLGMHHLSTVSVLKTAEQILGLPPLSLGDLLATDMSDFFTTEPDVRPFAMTTGRP